MYVDNSNFTLARLVLNYFLKQDEHPTTEQLRTFEFEIQGDPTRRNVFALGHLVFQILAGPHSEATRTPESNCLDAPAPTLCIAWHHLTRFHS